MTLQPMVFIVTQNELKKYHVGQENDGLSLVKIYTNKKKRKKTRFPI